MWTKKWHLVHRLLVMRLDNIGDVVLLSPALHTLRHALPQAAITLMASPAGSQAAPLLPWVDHVLTWRPIWQDVSGELPQNPQRELALIDTLRQGQFDAAIIFTSFSQSPYPPAYACYLAGIPLRLGQADQFGGSVLSDWVRPHPEAGHQAERNLFLLESVGFPIRDRHLALRVPDSAAEVADRLLYRHGIHPETPFILVSPGASCPSRRYPLDRCAAVLRLLAEQTCLPLVVTGSKDEQALFQSLLADDLGGRLISLVGQTSLPELAAVIQRASLVLTNNSGPMHIADAFDRPLVVLYSGTEHVSQWRPRHAQARLLRRPTPCSPCYDFHCTRNLECLDIPPQEVAAEVLNMLANLPGKHNCFQEVTL